MSAWVLRMIVLQATWRCASLFTARLTDEYAPLRWWSMIWITSVKSKRPSQFCTSNDIMANSLGWLGHTMLIGSIPTFGMVCVSWVACVHWGVVYSQMNAIGDQWMNPEFYGDRNQTLWTWYSNFISVHHKNGVLSNEGMAIDDDAVGRKVLNHVSENSRPLVADTVTWQTIDTFPVSAWTLP